MTSKRSQKGVRVTHVSESLVVPSDGKRSSVGMSGGGTGVAG